MFTAGQPGSTGSMISRRSNYLLPLLLLLALLAGLLVPPFMEFVRPAGHFIPQPRIERDYAIGLLWAMFLALSILVWPVPQRDKPALLIVWAGKCFVTLVFMLVYEWLYDLDAYAHLLVGNTRTYPWDQITFGDGTAIVHGMAWIFARFTPDSYHAMKVTFAMMGMIGVYLFYRAIAGYGYERRRIFLFIGLFPSILFWSSTIGKDPIQLLWMGLYVYGTLGFLRTRRFVYAVICAAGIIFAAAIRVWMGPIMVAPLLLIAVVGIRGWFTRTVTLLAAALGLVVLLSSVQESFDLSSLQDVVEYADAMGAGWEGGSGQTRTADLSSVGGMLRFAPFGMFTALFRPLPGEVMNPFGLLAGLESLILISLAILAVIRTRWRVIMQPQVLWALGLVMTWSAVYGFVSVYNLGAAVRFKLQILPVLVLISSYLAFRPQPTQARPRVIDPFSIPSTRLMRTANADENSRYRPHRLPEAAEPH